MTFEHADEFYIDGRWRPCSTSARAPVVNPATEQLVGQIALGSAVDVDGYSLYTLQRGVDLIRGGSCVYAGVSFVPRGHFEKWPCE